MEFERKKEQNPGDQALVRKAFPASISFQPQPQVHPRRRGGWKAECEGCFGARPPDTHGTAT